MPDNYFSWVRRDVLKHIPRHVRRVLSVGCGSGATEAELVKRGVDVVGIEINREAANLARKQGLTVLEGDAAHQNAEAVCSSRDCLVYADILEHLSDPVGVLRRHIPLLETGGTVVISVPNFRNYRVFIQLFLNGLIRYSDSGILDRTHLILTTRKMVEKWMVEVGVRPRVRDYVTCGRKAILVKFFPPFLLEFIASQVIVSGTK